MPHWVNAEMVFRRRAKIFEFPVGDFRADAAILLTHLEERDAHAVESIARKLIVSLFPQYDNCDVTYFGYDYASHCLAVGICHPLLDEVPDGERLPRELVKMPAITQIG